MTGKPGSKSNDRPALQASLANDLPDGRSFLPDLADFRGDRAPIRPAQARPDTSAQETARGGTIILRVPTLAGMTVATPEAGARRARRARLQVGAGKVLVAPDRGPRHMPGDLSSGRMTAMAAGAAIMRAEPGRTRPAGPSPAGFGPGCGTGRGGRRQQRRCNRGTPAFAIPLQSLHNGRARGDADAVMGESRRERQGESCEARFRSLALASAKAFDAAMDLFLTSEDPQGPHKARVALRRLTTALDAFRPILRRKAAELWRARAKRIFAALGRVRDSDVHLADSQAKPGEKARRERNRLLRQKTRKAMRKRQVADFVPGLRTAVAEGGAIFRRSAKARDRREAPVGAFAAGALDEAWQRCLGHGRSVRAMTDEERHEFRKDIKTLRYLAEFFADLFPGLGDAPFAGDLRAIQDSLGTLNDFAVALEIEGRKPPARPPARIARAMDEAERLWVELSRMPLPWAGQATRRP